MTDDYQFDLPDDESLPLTRCACGQGFARWQMVLGMDRTNPTQCPNCSRWLWWSLVITIHEVPHD